MAYKSPKFRKSRIFESHITRIINRDFNMTITVNAKQQLNNCLCYIIDTISRLAMDIIRCSHRKTIYSKDITSVLCIQLWDEGSHLIPLFEDASNSILMFHENTLYTGSRSQKSGLTISPAICERIMRNYIHKSFNISSICPMYLASIIEGLLRRILICIDNKHTTRINIRDIELGIRLDNFLNKLFTRFKINFIGGGIIPFIHSLILEPKNNLQSKSIKAIRRYQTDSQCLILSKNAIKNTIKYIIHSINPSLKISHNIYPILHHFIEQYTIDIIRNANLIAVHANRIKLIGEDINIVNIIRSFDKTLNISDDLILDDSSSVSSHISKLSLSKMIPAS